MQNKIDRKWGYYNVIYGADNIKVKQLSIDPWQSISLQFHYNRAEHWFIVSGIALVEKGDKQIELAAGDHIKIEKMELHRVTNISNPREPLILIEVQVGDILDEHDIVRISQTGS